MESKLRTMIFRLLVLTLFLTLPFLSFGRADSLRYSKYLPNYLKVQFAGGIGFISPGIGYTFFNSKLDVTAFYGFVPKSIAKQNLHSISIQSTFKLLEYELGNVIVYPLNFGFFLHHTFGKDYWVNLPSYYPDKYYWWSPGRMGGVFLGGEVKTKLFADKTPSSGTAFYFRVGSRGLYLASLVGNTNVIALTDILEVGFGIALYR